MAIISAAASREVIPAHSSTRPIGPPSSDGATANASGRGQKETAEEEEVEPAPLEREAHESEH
ncbi:MAG TPA: hypothetical protein VLK53_13225 [Gaiellaceae bacterium]|nr:hypothetical protein [Gaiellaceae bacterium]